MIDPQRIVRCFKRVASLQVDPLPRGSSPHTRWRTLQRAQRFRRHQGKPCGLVVAVVALAAVVGVVSESNAQYVFQDDGLCTMEHIVMPSGEIVSATHFTYDERGLLINEVHDRNANGEADLVVTIARDQTRWDVAVQLVRYEIQARRYIFELDEAERPTAVEVYSDDQRLRRRETYHRDASGAWTGIDVDQGSDGETNLRARFEHDARGRLVAETITDHAGEMLLESRYTYADDDHMEQERVTRRDGATTQQFETLCQRMDANARMCLQDADGDGVYDFVVHTTYDADGRRLSLREHPAPGHLVGFHVARSYEAGHRSLLDDAYRGWWGYEIRGELPMREVVFEYDAEGRPTRVTMLNEGGEPHLVRRYVYDTGCSPSAPRPAGDP